MALLNVKITIPAVLEYNTDTGEVAFKGEGTKAIAIAPVTQKQAVKPQVQTKEAPARAQRLINAKEVAMITGFSVYTIYDYAKAGIIPCLRPMGKRVYFEKGEIEKWMRGLSVKYAVERG